MLDLPQVTYLSVIGNKTDKQYSDVDSILKIGQKTSKHINFGKKVIYTIEEPTIDPQDFEIKIIDGFKYEDFTDFVLTNYGEMFDTEFMINFHSDGFIRNPLNWQDEFLNYDFIGAPMCWKHHFILNGNGGFSLRSKKLCDLVKSLYIKNKESCNLQKHNEDLLISVLFKDTLNKMGCQFAPLDLCSKFSTEHHPPNFDHIPKVYMTPDKNLKNLLVEIVEDPEYYLHSGFFNSFGMHEIEKLLVPQCAFQRKKLYNYIFNDFEITEMTIDDVEFFNEVRNECREMLHDTTEFTLEESIKWFKETKPNFYIVKSGKQKIGYFRTSIENGLFFVGMDIHKNYRGSGLAFYLYLDFFEKIKNKTDKVNLLVKKKNTVAYNLYKKLGFIEKDEPLINIDNESFFMYKQL